MKKKWFIWFVVCLCCVFGLSIAAFGAHPISLLVNNQEVKLATPLVNTDGRIVGSVRSVAEALGKEVTWDKETQTVSISDKESLVAELPEQQIELKAKHTTNSELYVGFSLTVGESNRAFNWSNVTNPTYAPQLILEDINGDGKEELIIILTTAYGTGLRQTEAHVIDLQTLEEDYVENTKPILLNHVKASLSEKGLSISMNNKETFVPMDQLKSEPSSLFDEPVWGSIVSYDVIENQLRAQVPVQISPAGFAGHFEILYTFKNGFYQLQSLSYQQD